jgi:hypothetical protein
VLRCYDVIHTDGLISLQIQLSPKRSLILKLLQRNYCKACRGRWSAALAWKKSTPQLKERVAAAVSTASLTSTPFFLRFAVQISTCFLSCSLNLLRSLTTHFFGPPLDAGQMAITLAAWYILNDRPAMYSSHASAPVYVSGALKQLQGLPFSMSVIEAPAEETHVAYSATHLYMCRPEGASFDAMCWYDYSEGYELIRKTSKSAKKSAKRQKVVDDEAAEEEGEEEEEEEEEDDHRVQFELKDDHPFAGTQVCVTRHSSKPAVTRILAGFGSVAGGSPEILRSASVAKLLITLRVQAQP